MKSPSGPFLNFSFSLLLFLKKSIFYLWGDGFSIWASTCIVVCASMHVQGAYVSYLLHCWNRRLWTRMFFRLVAPYMVSWRTVPLLWTVAIVAECSRRITAIDWMAGVIVDMIAQSWMNKINNKKIEIIAFYTGYL